jgi:S1-C subfamily serine protease
VSQLLDAVASLEPGKPAPVTALRGKQELALTLDIVQRQRLPTPRPGR